jgi:WXG100 family type VII secretion target
VIIMVKVIRAQYEELEAIALRFGWQAQHIQQLRRAIQQCVNTLQHGDWKGQGASSFFNEMDAEVLPALERLTSAMEQAQTAIRKIIDVFKQTEGQVAEQFKIGVLAAQVQFEHVGEGQSLAMASLGIPAPAGPPPIPVPGDSTNGWKWNPNPQNSRGGSWGPKEPIPGQGQPSGSWDPEGHWDVDDGKGRRQRYDEKGQPISPEEAHGKKEKSEEEPDGKEEKSEPAKFEISSDLLKKAEVITGLTGAALITYLIISEGSRLFPPRNLIPIP